MGIRFRHDSFSIKYSTFGQKSLNNRGRLILQLAALIKSISAEEP